MQLELLCEALCTEVDALMPFKTHLLTYADVC
jgi:hypothetical protein